VNESLGEMTKKKVTTSKSSGVVVPVVLTVEQLENKVAEGGSGLKSILELIQRSQTQWENENEREAARHALRRSFGLLLERGELKVNTNASEEEKSVSLWLVTQFEEFLDLLVNWTWNERSSQSERVAALRTIFWFAARERFLDDDDVAQSDEVEITFGRRSLEKLIEAGCCQPSLQVSQDLVMRTIRDEYMNAYLDFQLYFLRALRKVFITTRKFHRDEEISEDGQNEQQQEQNKARFNPVSGFQFINLVPLPHLKSLEDEPQIIVEYGEDPRGLALRAKMTQKLRKIGLMRKAFQNAWLSFLRLKALRGSTYKSVLIRLPAIIPHFVQPLLLSDFLTDSFSINVDSSHPDGDEIPLLSLSALFVLVRDYGLDYPNLYIRLYDLVRPSLFHSRNRESFCQLLDACLKSSHLPAYLIASFCKRLARVALLSTPSASMFALAMIYNLLRRHPNCVFLIHRLDNKKKNMLEQDEALEEAKKLKEIKEASKRLAMGLNPNAKSQQEIEDPFIYSEIDPAKSRATETSLWEIETLQSHYCPSVASFARSVFAHDLAKDRLTKPELPINDFIVDYQDLFLQEARLKKQQDQGGNKRLKVDAPLRAKKPEDDCAKAFFIFS
jgi:U3 small nucleolar RNA-associated protein 19